MSVTVDPNQRIDWVTPPPNPIQKPKEYNDNNSPIGQEWLAKVEQYKDAINQVLQSSCPARTLLVIARENITSTLSINKVGDNLGILASIPSGTPSIYSLSPGFASVYNTEKIVEHFQLTTEKLEQLIVKKTSLSE